MTQTAHSRFINITPLSAGAGDQPTGMAAYIARAAVTSPLTGEMFDFTHRRDELIHAEVMLPPGVDRSFADIGVLWARMERAEIRKTPRRSGPRKQTRAQHAALIAMIDAPGPKRLTRDELALAWLDDAQLAYHFVLALPWPFTKDQHIAAIRTFYERELLPHGFICQAAIHPPDEDSPLNTHAHLLVTTRRVDGLEVGKKIRGALAEFANKDGGTGVISPDGRWPDRWAAIQEDVARAAGVDLRIAPKSAIPEPHLGKSFHMDNTEKEAARTEAKAEATAAIQLPGLLPELLTESQPTFSEDEAREALEHHGVPADKVIEALEDLHTFPEVLPLFDRETGRFSGRFTTAEIRAQEQRIRELAAGLGSQAPASLPQARLAAAAADLGGKLAGRPVARLLTAATAARSIVLVEAPVAEQERLLLALAKVRDAAKLKLLGIAPTTGAACLLRRAGLPAATLATELRLQASGKVSAWGPDISLVIWDADLFDADSYEQLLEQAAKAGTRLILIGPEQPRHSIGRGGAYPIVRAAIGAEARPATTAVEPNSRCRPSSDLAAASDRPTSRRSEATSASPVGAAARPAVVRTPRPWRRPGASLSEIWNLSCAADCNEIERQLKALPPEEAATSYQALPHMARHRADREVHPLADLHTNMKVWLHRLGIDWRTGKTDEKCLEVPVNNPASFKDRKDLAPAPGYPDVRRLLAPIDSIDLADWHAIKERTSCFSIGRLRDILDGLGSLIQRSGIGEAVLHAISFARLQLYLLGKETGRDLLPDLAPDDLWSIIPAGERIRAAVRFDDYDGKVKPILAAALLMPAPETVKKASAPIATPETPIWLKLPSWSPLGCWGVDPLGVEKGAHFMGLHRATPEQRAAYCDGLLQIRAQSGDPGMRAWSTQGLQHLADWHRLHGKEHFPVALEIVARASDHVFRDWHLAPDYKGDPFRAAREMRILEHLSRRLVRATERADQMSVAEQIAMLPRRRDGDPRVTALLDAARAPATYLRLHDGRCDPAILGNLIADLARKIGEPVPGPAAPQAQPQTNVGHVVPRTDPPALADRSF